VIKKTSKIDLMIYQIESDKVPKIVIKKIIKFLLLLVGMVSIILLWTSQNLTAEGSITSILLRAAPKFSMVILFIVVVGFYQLHNFYKSLAFQVTNDAVVQFIFGSEQHKVIPYALITSINISPSRIKIKSVNYNLSNENGSILIPCETTQYEDLVKHFEKLKKDFEL